MSSGNVFRTKRLALASFIHASALLEFRGVKEGQGRKMWFTFDDPQRQGLGIEDSFDRLAPCPALLLFDSQTFMRKQMTKTQNEMNGENRNVYERR